MTTTPIPDGYHTLTPYLLADDLDRLIAFLQDAFEATEHHRLRGEGGRTMHADLRIGDSHVMLGAARLVCLKNFQARPSAR